MPIKIKTDLELGSVWYIKNDPDHFPHILVGIVIVPGNQFKFKLSYLGDVQELHDFECTDVPPDNKDTEDE